MANKDNIKKHQFKKGQSGNPKGRPQTVAIRDQIKDKINEKGVTDNLIKEILKMALSKKVAPSTRLSAIQWIVENVDGKLSTEVNVKGIKTVEIPVVKNME